MHHKNKSHHPSSRSPSGLSQKGKTTRALAQGSHAHPFQKEWTQFSLRQSFNPGRPMSQQELSFDRVHQLEALCSKLQEQNAKISQAHRMIAQQNLEMGQSLSLQNQQLKIKNKDLTSTVENLQNELSAVGRSVEKLKEKRKKSSNIASSTTKKDEFLSHPSTEKENITSQTARSTKKSNHSNKNNVNKQIEREGGNRSHQTTVLHHQSYDKTQFTNQNSEDFEDIPSQLRKSQKIQAKSVPASKNNERIEELKNTLLQKEKLIRILAERIDFFEGSADSMIRRISLCEQKMDELMMENSLLKGMKYKGRPVGREVIQREGTPVDSINERLEEIREGLSGITGSFSKKILSKYLQ